MGTLGFSIDVDSSFGRGMGSLNNKYYQL